MNLFGWLRPPYTDHRRLREGYRLDRTAADAVILLDSYFRKGFLSRRRVKHMGSKRWTAAYKLLRCAGLVDPVNGHIRTRSYERALAALRREVDSLRAQLYAGNFTLPF